MPLGLTGQIAAADADPNARQDARVVTRPRWQRVAVIGLSGIIAYVLALVASLPAGRVFDPGSRWSLGGTVWNGEALLAGTHRLEWHWSALRTITSGRFAVDWRLSGNGSDLAGVAATGSSRITLEEVSGDADGSLLAALAPTLPFTCATAMEVRIDRLAIGGTEQGGSARLRSHPGTCTTDRIQVATLAVPALIGTLSPEGDTTRLSLATAASRRELIRGSLTRRGHLQVVLTRAGSQVIPFAASLATDTWL